MHTKLSIPLRETLVSSIQKPRSLQYWSITRIQHKSQKTSHCQMIQNDEGSLILDFPKKVILGSKSFTRRLILEEMGIDPVIRVADIDEKAIGDRVEWEPERLVLALGHAKADAILASGLYEGDTAGLLITGDQVVVHENRIIEKPQDIEEARSFIESYGRSPPKTVGSVVITDIASGQRLEGVDTATIHFLPFPEEVIGQLLSDEMILKCAGGLMVEHDLVQPYLERIEGTIDSVMGLSKPLVYDLIQKMNDTL